MNFSFTNEQQDIQATFERVFRDLSNDEAIKNLSDSGLFFHRACWQQLADTGVLGLPLAEEYGGSGLSLTEFCLLLELQGKYVTPMPLLAHVIGVGMTVQASNNKQLKNQLLPDLIRANKLFSSAQPYRGLLESNSLSGERKADTLVLNGRTGPVAYAELADGFLVQVPVMGNQTEADALVYLSKDAQGLDVVAQTAINDEPSGYLQFADTEVSAGALLADETQAAPLIALQTQWTRIAMAAILLGALDEGLKRTAEYVSTRKQFGRSLGSFQAVSQQAADAYMEIESLRSVYWRALDDNAAGKDGEAAAQVVKFWISEAGHKVGHAILHLHGGIGQDLEYPIHRFFLFAKQLERMAGTQEQMSAALGAKLLAANATQLSALCE